MFYARQASLTKRREQAPALQDAARRACSLCRIVILLLCRAAPVDDNLPWDVLKTASRLKHSLSPGVVRNRTGATQHFDWTRRKPAWPAQKLPPPQATGSDNSFGRIIGVLFSPKPTFESIVRRPTWVVPVVLGCVSFHRCGGDFQSAREAGPASYLKSSRQQFAHAEACQRKTSE